MGGLGGNLMSSEIFEIFQNILKKSYKFIESF
jgi:hypothetical protein